jgi:hypothetical protein
MSEKNSGGPAFPINDAAMVHTVAAAAIQGVSDSAERDRIYIEASRRAASGMTLRDYFAARALIGLMSEPLMGNTPATAFSITKDENLVDTYAISAYKLADAMLAARGT